MRTGTRGLLFHSACKISKQRAGERAQWLRELAEGADLVPSTERAAQNFRYLHLSGDLLPSSGTCGHLNQWFIFQSRPIQLFFFFFNSKWNRCFKCCSPVLAHSAKTLGPHVQSVAVKIMGPGETCPDSFSVMLWCTFSAYFIFIAGQALNIDSISETKLYFHHYSHLFGFRRHPESSRNANSLDVELSFAFTLNNGPRIPQY